jgi:hypothetical protein
LAKGETDAAATREAVRSGVISEKTYFGTLVSGVYSNADLCANYAGMMFYQGLTGSIRTGGTERPATLQLIEGVWKFNESVSSQLLRPFTSDHLNEALNPSILVPGLRSSVRRVVRKQSCVQWQLRFPASTKHDYESLTQSLQTWYGEDYGFRDSKKLVTIANTCF